MLKPRRLTTRTDAIWGSVVVDKWSVQDAARIWGQAVEEIEEIVAIEVESRKQKAAREALELAELYAIWRAREAEKRAAEEREAPARREAALKAEAEAAERRAREAGVRAVRQAREAKIAARRKAQERKLERLRRLEAEKFARRLKCASAARKWAQRTKQISVLADPDPPIEGWQVWTPEMQWAEDCALREAA